MQNMILSPDDYLQLLPMRRAYSVCRRRSRSIRACRKTGDEMAGPKRRKKPDAKHHTFS